MGQADKAIDLGSSLVMTLLIIGAAIVIVTTGVLWLNKQANKASELQTNMDQSTYTTYENKEINGVQVVNLVKTWSTGDVYCKIKPLSGSEYYVYYENGDMTKPMKKSDIRAIVTGMSDPTNTTYYINEAGAFKVTCEYDTNDILRGVLFTQRQ